jgi:CubicO group peptidase (beta-lactamase class C family)
MRCRALLPLFAIIHGCRTADQASEALPITEVSRAETASDSRLIEALRAYVPLVMKEHDTPGLNLALARRGKVIWEAGFGYANLETRRPMTPETAFHSGSMGKTYVATAIMQLVEQGVLELDAPVNRYLKEFQVTNPLGDRPVTVRDLLTHRSGIGPNGASSSFAKPRPLAEHLKRAYADSMLEMYNRSTVRLWTAKVGQTFQYSNLGMATLGHVVEATNPEKLSFSDYIQKHIMDPLGMTATRYPPIQDSVHLGAEIWTRMSTGYTGLGRVHLPTPTIYFADYPAGTVVSSPGQHIKLMLAYLGRGTYNGHRLLQPKTVSQMLTPQGEGFGSTAIGLTWFLFDVGRQADTTGELANFTASSSFGHGGAHMYGWNNEYRGYPKLDVAVMVATNHWRLPNDALGSETTLIQDFVSSWIRNEFARPEPDSSVTSWAWKTSYVAGLLLADNLVGQLGNPDPVTQPMIDAMVAGARAGGRPAGLPDGWDADGFRTGLSDLLKVVQVPDSIRAFAKSDRLRVSQAELDQISKELGSRTIPLLAGPLQ